MAKTTGFPATISVDDSSTSAQDISNDVTNFSFATPRGVQNTTGVDSSAMERLLLLADASITLNGVFNTAANLSFQVLKTVPSTSVERTVSITVTSQILSNECLFTDFSFTRPQTGEMTWAAPAVLSDGTVPTWTT